MGHFFVLGARIISNNLEEKNLVFFFLKLVEKILVRKKNCHKNKILVAKIKLLLYKKSLGCIQRTNYLSLRTSLLGCDTWSKKKLIQMGALSRVP